MRDSRSEIETIKSRAGIVDIISEYVVLKKAGRNFVGLCPFHKEKTPSFSVNAEKQIFYCFGCGAGGDVFEFLIKINNMSFPEAMNHLAEKTGVVLREKRSGQAGEEKTLREEIKKINHLAEKYFADNLLSNSGKSAREYLRKRGINDSTVKEFHLGLALNSWRHLRDFFEQKKIPLQMVEKSGLIIRSEKGDFYDRFRSRVIFPIENIAGDVIAFGGRASGDEKPKYLNSPESPIYTKGKNLYGFNRSRDEIRRKGYAVLVEGYFDVLSLWNAGIRNAVAALGTALTRDHLDLLRRFTTSVIAIFDPDEGGRSALERSLVLFLEEKFHARVVILPENLDPDDYIKKHGPEAMEKLIADSQSMVDYYIENVIGSKRGFEENRDALREAVPFISRIEDPVQRNLFTKRVSEKLNVDQALLKSEITKASSGRRPAKLAKQNGFKNVSSLSDSVEMTMIHLIMEFPEKLSGLDSEIFDYFQDPNLKPLGKEFKRIIQDGREFVLADFLSGMGDNELRKRILSWTMSDTPFDGDMSEKLFTDTIDKIKTRWLRTKKEEYNRELRLAEELGDTDRCDKLLYEITKLLETERKIKNG